MPLLIPDETLRVHWLASVGRTALLLCEDEVASQFSMLLRRKPAHLD